MICEFLRSQAEGILAFDFLNRGDGHASYVLFAIEIASRRIRVLGVTRNTDPAWVTQQTRNLVVGEGLQRMRFLIRDREHQVLRSVRRSVPLPECEDHRDADSRSSVERIRGTVGPHGPERVPGLDTGARPQPPGASASDLHRALTTPEGPIEVLT